MFPMRVNLAILFYAIVLGAIVVYRPRALFDDKDRPLDFGTGPEQTVFGLGTVAAGTAVISFALFTLVDIIAPGGPAFPLAP